MARYPALTPRLHEVVEDQLKLLQAIIRGDAQTAQEVAAAHVRNFQVAFQEVMLAGANQPESAAPPAIIGADAAATAHRTRNDTRCADLRMAVGRSGIMSASVGGEGGIRTHDRVAHITVFELGGTVFYSP